MTLRSKKLRIQFFCPRIHLNQIFLTAKSEFFFQKNANLKQKCVRTIWHDPFKIFDSTHCANKVILFHFEVGTQAERPMKQHQNCLLVQYFNFIILILTTFFLHFLLVAKLRINFDLFNQSCQHLDRLFDHLAFFCFVGQIPHGVEKYLCFFRSTVFQKLKGQHLWQTLNQDCNNFFNFKIVLTLLRLLLSLLSSFKLACVEIYSRFLVNFEDGFVKDEQVFEDEFLFLFCIVYDLITCF